MRIVSKVLLVLALLGGPWACLSGGADRITTASIGGLMAVDLNACIVRSGSWAAYDACAAALQACARAAKTVTEYDICSDGVTR